VDESDFFERSNRQSIGHGLKLFKHRVNLYVAKYSFGNTKTVFPNIQIHSVFV